MVFVTKNDVGNGGPTIKLTKATMPGNRVKGVIVYWHLDNGNSLEVQYRKDYIVDYIYNPFMGVGLRLSIV